MEIPIFKKIGELEKRYEELGNMLSDPEVISDHERLRKYAKEHSDLEKIVGLNSRLKKTQQQIDEDRVLLNGDDEELKALAKEELKSLDEEIASIEEKLKNLLIPKDPRDDKNLILEIRAGTGGDEAGLFAADLLRMYLHYAGSRSWRTEILSQSPTDIGGLKEVILSVEGQGAFSRFKYESGVHRVQRVPETETQGRIHTSAVTVAVLAEADDLEVKIEPADLRIDVFRSSGPGGQSVNTTDSAVRITHLPTGLVISCQDEKSQHKNKAKAMRVLRARLLDKITAEQHSQMSEERRSQVGSGDRSERIRTYNFPQNRVTDHRMGMTLYRLNEFLQGDLEEMIDGLIAHYRAEM